MARVAPQPPAETDLLCESCGYVLNGLPPDARCPECGVPANESSPGRRQAPAWERNPDAARVFRFLQTTREVLLRPSRFYRHLATRPQRGQSHVFARIHWILASILFGSAAYAHFQWVRPQGLAPWWMAFLFIIGIYCGLAWTTRLAARLTHIEATYRGLRLPVTAVRRGLDYHAAQYLPVALLAAVTVLGYRAMLALHLLGGFSALPYVYVLCGEVVVGAGYLFNTYWIGMRNMMYANG